MGIQNQFKAINSEADLQEYRDFLDKDRTAKTNYINSNVSRESSLTSFLKNSLGKAVAVKFMLNKSIVTKYGILKQVDNDFLILYNNKTKSEILCRNENIIFVNRLH